MAEPGQPTRQAEAPTCVGFWAHLSYGWNWLEDLGSVLKPTRFSVLTVLVTAVLVIFVAQGREALLVVAEDTDPASVLIFLFSLLWLSTVCWYCARQILDSDPTPAPPEPCAVTWLPSRAARIRWLRDYVPRLLGTAPAVAVVLGLARAMSEGEGIRAVWWRIVMLMVLVGVSGGAFLVFVVWRRDVSRWLGVRLRRAAPGVALYLSTVPARTGRPDTAFDGRRRLAGSSTVTLVLLWTAAVIGGALFVLAIVAPVRTGWFLGPAPVVFLAAAAWIPLGTWLVYVSRERDFPILTVLLVIAVIASLWNDNHAVRTVAGPPSEARLDLPTALAAWQERQRALGGDPLRPIIVATAGGASRAGYWTAAVLGRLADDDPAFAPRVFAISGVSGGSLGAAVFAALARGETAPTTCITLSGERASGFYACGRAVLGHDFLGPVFLGALLPDLAQRFNPLPAALAAFPSRATAIEAAWERAWRVTFPGAGADLFDRRSAELWPRAGRPWTPALLLNGTSVSSGERLLWATIVLPTAPAVAGTAAVAPMQVVDLPARMAVDVPLSTAVNMSARFPIVEPAGTLRFADGTRDRIVDGGYHENNGAATAEELLLRLKAIAPELRPVVIQITSDPGLDDDADAPGGFLSEVVDPVIALYMTRQARGAAATKSLERTVGDIAGSDSYLAFRLCHLGGTRDHRDPPMSWAVSHEAMALMDQHVVAMTGAGPAGFCPGNRAAYQAFAAGLRS